MPKSIVIAFLVAIGTILWALQPAPEYATQEVVEAETSAVENSPEVTDNAERRIAKDRVEKSATTTAKVRPSTDIPRRPHDELVAERKRYLKVGPNQVAMDNTRPEGAKVNTPWPVATEGEHGVPEFVDYDKVPYEKYKRKDSPFPAVATAQFKDSIRRYYGGLPAGGQVTGPVIAADVLPAPVITGLKVPPDSRLTMLGPFNVDHEKVWENALNSPDQGEVVFGVSYVTPSGESHRKYIRLAGDPTSP